VTATDSDIALAATAQARGEATERERRRLASQMAGYGALLALPQDEHPRWPPFQGEGYGVPADVPAVRPVTSQPPTPTYADPVVAGLDYPARVSVGARRSAWPRVAVVFGLQGRGEATAAAAAAPRRRWEWPWRRRSKPAVPWATVK
jgi:hypothetical protein